MASSSTISRATMYKKIASNPKFSDLVRKRRTFAWFLSSLVLGIYAGFILLVAYGRDFLGTPVTEGSVTTIAFPIAVGVILVAVALTGLYVRRANTEFDELNRQILKEAC